MGGALTCANIDAGITVGAARSSNAPAPSTARQRQANPTGAWSAGGGVQRVKARTTSPLTNGLSAGPFTYDVPPGRSFALDGFPEQLHNPITDHNDFIDVMSDTLMAQAVNCVNTGQRCR